MLAACGGHALEGVLTSRMPPGQVANAMKKNKAESGMGACTGDGRSYSSQQSGQRRSQGEGNI